MSKVTEQEIEKTTVAPRVTLEGLEANIVHEYTFNASDFNQLFSKGYCEKNCFVFHLCNSWRKQRLRS